MDSFTFRSTIFEKRFEAFCDDVLSNKIFREIKGRNYLSRYKDAGFPFDAECDGQINSVRGGILFEFKSAGAQTPDQSARGGFIRDLCGGENSKGKLVRSAELRPDAKHFVLVMSVPSTENFERKIKAFISQKDLPFQFHCWSSSTIAEWLGRFPSLLIKYGPPSKKASMGDFIAELKRQGASVDFPQYWNLDNIYVPPREYDEIMKILREKHIVFIVGPPHVGKTFTAARILWHYYSERLRKPRWVTPKPLEPEPISWKRDPERRSSEPGETLVALIKENVGHDRVTYVEDLFGRTSDEEAKWKDYSPGELLFHLAEYVRSQSESRVVVTSREKIFDDALKADSRLKGLVVKLEGRVDLKASSYTAGDKATLMEKYAGLHECEWFAGDASLPADVARAAGELATPQAIALFCGLARTAKSPKEREQHIQSCKQELTTAFANEIAALDDATLAVLLVAQLTRSGHDVFAAAFPGLAGDDPGAVWKQAEENLGDRASFTEGDAREVDVAYVHPGYREAVYLALEAPRVNALLNSMISGLGKSAEIENRRCAVNAALRSYVHLNRDGRDILKALVRDRATEVREWAADALAWKFAGLDREGREILKALARDPASKVRQSVATGLAWDFADLDRDGRDILKALARDRKTEVRRWAADGLARNFKALDREGREIVQALARDPRTMVRQWAADALARNFAGLDREGREILKALARDRKMEVRLWAADALAWDFAGLDREGREILESLKKSLGPLP